MSDQEYVDRALCFTLLGFLFPKIVPSPTEMPDGPFFIQKIGKELSNFLEEPPPP